MQCAIVKNQNLSCDSKKSKLIKQQEASGLSSSLGIKTPLSKIPLIERTVFSNYMLNGKAKIVLLTVGLIKKA